MLRDSLFYVAAIGITTCVVWDGHVDWWEALAMVLCSLAHLTFMFTHLRLARWARTLLARTDSTIVLTTGSASARKASEATRAAQAVQAADGAPIDSEAQLDPAVVVIVSQLPGAAKSDKTGQCEGVRSCQRRSTWRLS